MTVVDDEFDAVQDEFDARVEVGVSGVFGPTDLDDGYCPFILAQCPSRSNMPAMGTAIGLIESWRPEALILVGVAGGVRRPSTGGEWSGPNNGDVVIADYIHYADFTKNVDGEELMRYYPVDQPARASYGAHASAIRRSEWWRDLVVERPIEGQPALEVGNLLAVEGLAGDPSSERQQNLLKRFDHAIAVDMESNGVSRALYDSRNDVHYNPGWACVRGISDPVFSEPPSEEVDNGAERAVWRRYAAAAAGRVAHLMVKRMLSQPRPARPEDPGRPAFERGR